MWRLLTFLTVLGLGGVLGFPLLERYTLYPFDSTEVSPAEAGAPRLTAQTLENDGETLVVWTAPPKRGKPVILYFHGNAGNLAARTGRFNRFLDKGYGLAALAYRGSSGSTGSPSEDALIWDAEALYQNLADILPTNAPRVLYGESLGTGVAIALMNTGGVTEVKGAGPPAAIILEAPYTSMPDIARAMDLRLEALLPYLNDTWNSLSRAKALTSPLFVLHGRKDELIPIEQGRQIYAAAPSTQKEFFEVPSAGHSDLWRSDTLPKLWRFIERHALKR